MITTFEDWLAKQGPAETVTLSAAWDTAIEAMRAESEPEKPIAIEAALDPFIKIPNDIYSAAVKLNHWAAENNLRQWSIYGVGQGNPQPLRELSRDEVTELWHQATQEEGGIGKVVERFAKLVREVK